MTFELETILLLVLVFGASALVGFGLRVRARRNRLGEVTEPRSQPEPTSAIAPPDTTSPASGAESASVTTTQGALKPAEMRPDETVQGEVARHPGVRPPALAAPLDGRADDLKVLRGVGPQNEARLNGLGIYHLHQIASWSPAEAQWVGSYLAFSGRIERENWVGQARMLVSTQGMQGGTITPAQQTLPLTDPNGPDKPRSQD